jgi:hypothetical protein
MNTSFEAAHVRHVRIAKNRLAPSFAKSQCGKTEYRFSRPRALVCLQCMGAGHMAATAESNDSGQKVKKSDVRIY